MDLNFTDTLLDGTTVHIRPINRDDVELERAFVEGLSKQTRYYRFLGGVSRLTEEELQQLCDIDLKKTMAFIATTGTDERPTQVGVARFAADEGSNDAEIALTITDDWKQKGLGKILLKRLIDYAEFVGIRRLYSIELAGNTDITNLARECGFTVDTDPADARQVILDLALAPAESPADV